MAIMKSEYFIFIFAVIILTTNIAKANAIGTEIIDVGSATLDAGSTATFQVNLANAVDEEITSFVEQIDTASKESSVNDEITQSAPVTYESAVGENNPEDLTSPSPSATDQISTLGFGFVTTVLILFL